MAAPSALSRLMQIVNPAPALSPAGRILFFRDQQVDQQARVPAEVSDHDETALLGPSDQAARRISASYPSSRPPSMRFHSAQAEAADILPTHAVAYKLRQSFEPDCPLAPPPSGKFGLDGVSAQRRSSANILWTPEGLSSTDVLSLGVAEPGFGLATGTALLPDQDEGLRGNGRASPIVRISSSSPAALDSFTASLITTEGLEDAFYIMDIGTLDRLFLTWKAALPRIIPFYAVKCNPSPLMLSVLEVLGAGFDCASEAEIKQVLSLGVSPDRIIFANPCKMPSHIKFAAQTRVATTTFDSEAELDKIQAIYPESNLVLRIQTKDSGARCPLGTKYGALPEEVEGLLDAAATRNLAVVGVSFHVGSGAADASAYHSAIAAAHDVFQLAASAGRPMSLLDIGGGFTAPREAASEGSSMNFFQAANAINAALDEFFPDGCGVKIIAEPGRYFAETPSTLAARVFGKRIRNGHREYWINDGLYGSMNCTLYDHAVLTARPLLVESAATSGANVLDVDKLQASASGAHHDLHSKAGSLFSSTVFGPTCDGLDVVLRGVELPELEMGDWLIFPNMGAYTAAAGSSFNGFATSQLNTHIVFSSTGMAAQESSCLPSVASPTAQASSYSLENWEEDEEPLAMAQAC